MNPSFTAVSIAKYMKSLSVTYPVSKESDSSLPYPLLPLLLQEF